MKIEDVSPEVIEKAKACETPEQIFVLVKDGGIELTDEQLQSVSGGSWGDCNSYVDYCPKNCGATFTAKLVGRQTRRSQSDFLSEQDYWGVNSIARYRDPELLGWF